MINLYEGIKNQRSQSINDAQISENTIYKEEQTSTERVINGEKRQTAPTLWSIVYYAGRRNSRRVGAFSGRGRS